ncbi:tumor necrosis factor receptor superfamily member 9 [Ctenodactylus gundi]
MQDPVMGNGYYNMVTAVLLVMSFERTSSMQESCDSCPAGIFRTKKPCLPTSDAECECIEGLRCSGPKCRDCFSGCGKGQELRGEGCKDCRFGTFNDKEDGVCRPWTNCSLERKSVRVNGTKYSDVTCDPLDITPGPSPQNFIVFLALMSATVLFLLLFLVLRLFVVKQSREKFVYIFKQPFMKPVQTAQEEDACSCRFPEEEEGESEL